MQLTATNISTKGQFSTAINAVSTGISGTPGGKVAVIIPSGGSVTGGWQAAPFSLSNPTAPGTVGPVYGLPAAGIILNSAGGTATLTNDGSIGALSDLAIVGDPQVINDTGGTITGFTQFTGGNNSILNNGTFDLRNFADTNGNGVRDTVRVATQRTSATGPTNSFTNNGTLEARGSDSATRRWTARASISRLGTPTTL